MKMQEADIAGSNQVVKVPRRDWVLLPALSLLTVAILAASMETIAQRLFAGKEGGLTRCLITNDSATGVRGVPNSVCRLKVPEGQQVEFKFNSCGDYAGMDCGPKPRDTYRIVMVGTSIAMGWRVPREQSFAALLPVELSRRTGRKVELYNKSLLWEYPRVVDLRFDQVLAAQPDMILWVLSARDVQYDSFVLPESEQAPMPEGRDALSGQTREGDFTKAVHLVKHTFATKSIPDAFNSFWKRSRSRLMLLHYLYELESQNQYIQDAMKGSDADDLKPQLNAEWTARLKQLDDQVADVETRASSAGVPLAVVMIPTHGHAAILASGEWPASLDPYQFDRALRAIVVRHGATYLDILPEFRATPDVTRYYFPADGHPNEVGNAAIARFLAKEMTQGAVPALSNPTARQMASKQEAP